MRQNVDSSFGLRNTYNKHFLQITNCKTTSAGMLPENEQRTSLNEKFFRMLYKSWAVAEIGDRLATINIGRKVGAAAVSLSAG